jgi:CelD/BcsL family acetyltransferase involved in cellulose biosynthesis
MGERFTIRIAARGDHAVAAIATLTYKDTVMYKYACSDESLNNLGGMPFLVWNVIREAKEEGFAKLDLGRCELDNPGLRTFKERLAATRTTLTYWRYQHVASPNFCTPRSVRSAGVVFSHLPIPLLTACGKLLYRHIG